MPAKRGASPTWPYVLAFAEAMEAKLAENRHKGDRAGWLAMDPDWLLRRLKEETRELRTAMDVSSITLGCAGQVLMEAADVANFAMMIADVCGGLHAPSGRRRKG